MEEPISCGLRSACRARAVVASAKKTNGGGAKSNGIGVKKSLSKKKMFPYRGRVK